MPYRIAPRCAAPCKAPLWPAHFEGSLARLVCLVSALVPLVAATEAAAGEGRSASAGPPPLPVDFLEETPVVLLQSVMGLQQAAPRPAAARTVAALLEASERGASGGTASAAPGVATQPPLPASAGSVDRGAAHAAPGLAVQHGVTTFLAYTALLLFVGAGIFYLNMAHLRFHRLKAIVGPEFAWDFRAYLQYSFDSWFSTGSGEAILLAALALLLLFSGAALCCLYSRQHFDDAIFSVYTMIVDPANAIAQPRAVGKVIGLWLTVGFLVVLGLGLAMIQNGFVRVMRSLHADHRPVVEAEHILLIGRNGDTPQVIQELCTGYEPTGGTTIVLLAQDPRHEVEESLEWVNPGKSTVVVRSGVLDSRHHLRLVSADAAKMVVLMPRRDQAREAQDALAASVLVTLCGCGWPVRGRILAVCALAQNQPLFQRLGGPTCDTVSTEDFLGKLMVQCSRQGGIGVLFTSLFSFKGSEFYIAPAPKQLLGQNFGQARFHYPSSILVGVTSSAGCRLCPSAEYVLAPDDELILVAEYSTDIVPTREPIAPPVPPTPSGHQVVRRSPSFAPAVEMILMLGWNDHVGGVILLELDRSTRPGSKVVILSPQPTQEREECVAMLQRRASEFTNIQVQQVAGRLGSRLDVDSLPVKAHEASRIFILSEHAESAKDADRCTIITLLQVRDIIASSKEPRAVPIVPEIRDHHTEQICHDLKITNFVDSSGISAQILAAITYMPKLAPVFADLISEEGTATLVLRSLKEYLPAGSAPPDRICFYEVAHYVAAREDVVIGWSFMSESDTESQRPFDKRMVPLFMRSASMHWEMNPQNKAEVRPWNMESDRLAVIAKLTTAGL